MEIKLIAIDLDGTLLNDKLEVTDDTIATVNRVMEQGVEVVICTGRTLSELPKEFIEMPNIKYYITCNGAVIWDRKELKMIYENPILAEDVLTIIHQLEGYDMRIEVFALGRIFVDQTCYDRFGEYGGEEHDEFLLSTRTPVEHIIDFVEQFNHPIDKFNLFFKSLEDRQKVWDILVRLGYNVTSSFGQNMEVNSKIANKGFALKALTQSFGFSANEVMAFGDNLNDMTMLRYVGHPIAMGNAVSELKDIATYITKTNEENGVAHAMKKLVLKGERDGSIFF